MIRRTTVLGTEHEYELRKNTNSETTRRDVVYKGEYLGTIQCRGMQRNGYVVIDRNDIVIGHSQSGLAQILIVEHLLKVYMQKVSHLIQKEQIQQKEN